MRFIFMKTEKMLFEKRPINFADLIIPKKKLNQDFTVKKKDTYLFYNICSYKYIRTYILMKGAGYFRNTLKSNATTEKICFAF